MKKQKLVHDLFEPEVLVLKVLRLNGIYSPGFNNNH